MMLDATVAAMLATVAAATIVTAVRDISNTGLWTAYVFATAGGQVSAVALVTGSLAGFEVIFLPVFKTFEATTCFSD